MAVWCLGTGSWHRDVSSGSLVPYACPSKPSTRACICRPGTCTVPRSIACRWLTGGWAGDEICCLAAVPCLEPTGPGGGLGFGGTWRQCGCPISIPRSELSTLALPVNASLYRREFGTDQFKSFLASASRLYCRL